MNNLNILIVEGNPREENKNFSDAGIPTHTESLKESLNYFTKNLNFEVVNPSSDENLHSIKSKLSSYDGLIWGGSSLNIYNDTPEIRNQIEFMKECQKNVKKILAICWGMQVAVTAAGGEVKKASESHIGIANEITINEKGFHHPIYKDKNREKCWRLYADGLSQRDIAKECSHKQGWVSKLLKEKNLSEAIALQTLIKLSKLPIMKNLRKNPSELDKARESLRNQILNPKQYGNRSLMQHWIYEALK